MCVCVFFFCFFSFRMSPHTDGCVHTLSPLAGPAELYPANSTHSAYCQSVLPAPKADGFSLHGVTFFYPNAHAAFSPPFFLPRPYPTSLEIVFLAAFNVDWRMSHYCWLSVVRWWLLALRASRTWVVVGGISPWLFFFCFFLQYHAFCFLRWGAIRRSYVHVDGWFVFFFVFFFFPPADGQK